MKHEPISRAPRRPVNVSLDSELVADAKKLGVNLSRACERGLSEDLAKARGERWLLENRAALLAWNDWIEENGLPFEEHRQF